MSEHSWFPVYAEIAGCEIVVTYQNESGGEYVHVGESWGSTQDETISHSWCWKGCSGDWPACRAACPLFTGLHGHLDEWDESIRMIGKIPEMDLFDEMHNHVSSLDATNHYVEEFDTIDGSNWEISLDVSDAIQSFLDKENRDTI